eukprot:4476350-Prymnesium_polylepis.1
MASARSRGAGGDCDDEGGAVEGSVAVQDAQLVLARARDGVARLKLANEARGPRMHIGRGVHACILDEGYTHAY